MPQLKPLKQPEPDIPLKGICGICDEVVYAIKGRMKNPPVLISVQSRLKEDLSLDSLDIVELMLHLEGKYNVEYENKDLEPLSTIYDLAVHTSRLIQDRV